MFGQFPVVSQLEKCRSTVRASHTGSERIASLGVKVFYKVKTEAKFYAWKSMVYISHREMENVKRR